MDPNRSADNLLTMHNILKVYPNGTIANERVNFSLKEGEIHSLVGENGAGKSTLMKILYGVEKYDEGEIYFRGNRLTINSPNDAIENGIGMVHQHFMLVPDLTVAENVVLGIEPTKNGFFDMKKANFMVGEIAKQYEFAIDPKEKVKNLSVGAKQRVEIVKTLIRGAKLIILDEPTAVLTPQETQMLFLQLKKLSKNNYTIVFISHKLKEVKGISDRITIMRKGRNIGVFENKDITEEKISQLMMGKTINKNIEKKTKKPGDIVLQGKNITFKQDGKSVLKGVNIIVRKGEIIGVAGVQGNGQNELVDVITGMKKLHDGEIFVNGNILNDCSIREIREKKVAHIPEDRMTVGVGREGTIMENLVADKYYKPEFQKRVLMDNIKMVNYCRQLVKDYSIKTESIYEETDMLSGGNIQKVVVARELSSKPELVVANQPSRGIDIGSRNIIHNKLVELRDDGKAVLLISSDLEEILSISDSIVVMYEGEIVAYIDEPSKITEEELGSYMLGIERHSEDRLGRYLND